MAEQGIAPEEVVKLITDSGLTIYDDLTDHPRLYFSAPALQQVLQRKLIGLSLNHPLRTRSKIVKTAVCEALGYPVPPSFKKVRPRFVGQNFDTYTQKANNLQIWNEEVSRDRRYVIIRVSSDLRINAVRVVTGDDIAELNTTGTLTQKYQAVARQPVCDCVLASASDTSQVRRILEQAQNASQAGTQFPPSGFLPVQELYSIFRKLVGQTINDPGPDQERNRGAVMHELVQQALGHARMDTGRFPDVPEQLLEIKLQTSPTIDLGLVCPDSTEQVDSFPQARHCDVRYAVFYATRRAEGLRIDHVVVATGETFFTFFRKLEGKTINRKLQIRLPDGFWGQAE
jgi:hypothetical protein